MTHLLATEELVLDGLYLAIQDRLNPPATDASISCMSAEGMFHVTLQFALAGYDLG